MKRNHFLVLLVLVVAMFALSACGVPRNGVDVVNTAPSGLWQTLVVWPLAKALIGLNTFLSDISLPYSWGFAIILFTLAIKLVTFPLTMSQLKGMQAQKELQPKIQELQKKYGKDREKLSQEQMKLYKEAGVNPLSGCLPLLIQMPVLFGLYSALVALGTRLESARFFWIPSLGFPHYSDGLSWIADAFNKGNYTLLASYLVLPLLLMATQVIVQRMTTSATPTTGDGSQGGMMNQMSTVMTLMFGFFTLQVPAGLTLYWVTSNLLQLGQQYAVTGMSFGQSQSDSTGDGNLLDRITRSISGNQPTGAANNGTGSDEKEQEEEESVAASNSASKRPRRRRKKRGK